MSGVARRKRMAMLGVVGIAAALVLAGCGADGSDTATTDGAAPAAEPALGREAGAGPAPGAEQAGEVQPAKAPDLRVDQRAIVYTGSITVRVDNVDEAAAKVTAIVTAAGGFVGADKRTSGGDDQQATLELRVPAAKFSNVVDQIGGKHLGTEEQRGIDTQDVTEESLDLDARLASQQARVDSGRRLLAQAKTLGELVMLEGELAKREADLASLEAKKRRLNDLTALSTITAVLLGRGAAVEDEPTGFLGGLAAGWNALVASLKILLTVLGALLPWLLAFGVPPLVVFWALRRASRRRRATTPAAPTPAD